MKKFYKRLTTVLLAMVTGAVLICGVGAADFIYGDVNGSGSVDSMDALAVLKHSARIEIVEGDSFKAADVDGSESVDAVDALDILKFAAKIINSFKSESMITATPEATEAPTQRPQLTPLPTRTPGPVIDITYPTQIPVPEVSSDPANCVEGVDVAVAALNGAIEAEGIYTFTDDNAAAKAGIRFENPFAGKTELVESIESALAGQSYDLTDIQKIKYDPEAYYRRPVWSTGASLSFWVKYDWSSVNYSSNDPILVIHNSKSKGTDAFALKLCLDGEVKYEGGDEPNNSFRSKGFVAGKYNEWNYFTITIANDWITVYVNGVEVPYQSITLSKSGIELFNYGYMTRYNSLTDITEEEYQNDIRKYFTSSGIYNNGNTDAEGTLMDNGVYEASGYGLSSISLMEYITEADAEIYLGGVNTYKVNSTAFGTCEYALDSGTQVSGLKAYFTELTAEQVKANYDAAATEFLK